MSNPRRRRSADLDLIAACIAIGALILCGLPICALIFAGGGK